MPRFEGNGSKNWPELGLLLKNGGSFVLNFLYNRYNNKKRKHFVATCRFLMRTYIQLSGCKAPGKEVGEKRWAYP